MSDTANPIFPTVARSAIENALGDEANLFIKDMELKDTFAPNIEAWVDWFNGLGEGYQKLSQEGSDTKILNAQVGEFCRSFLTQTDHNVRANNTLFPANSTRYGDIRLEFRPAPFILVNDTTLSDRDLIPVLEKFGYAPFVLGKADVGNINMAERLKLQKVTDIFLVEPNGEESDNSYATDYYLWLEERWDIFLALNKEVGKHTTNILFEEIAPKVRVYDNLNITLTPRSEDSVSDIEILHPKFFVQESIDLSGVQSIFVRADDKKRNLIEYLCNHFFEWKAWTELVSVLMAEPIDIEEIRLKLGENNLPETLIDNFIALEKAAVEQKRKQVLHARDELTTLFEALYPSGHKGESEFERDEELEELDHHIDRTNTDTVGQTPKKKEGKSSKAKEVAHKKEKRKSRANFGTRLSGHLRPRNDNEIIGRKYFDDEDKSNSANKSIGEKAEKVIKSYIEKQLQPNDIELLGGNNKGFDIQYQIDGEMHYVEVKGLVGSWDDSDVLLSKSQFERAQLERDKFSIFIVEFVEDEDNRKIWEIRDPAEYFKKMQLDHGWKNFARSHNFLEPQIGRYLVYNDMKRQITRINKAGLLIKIFVENESKAIIYRPNKMTIEENLQN